MRNLRILALPLLASILFYGCSQSTPTSSFPTQKAELIQLDTVRDLGQLTEGQIVEATFRFQNHALETANLNVLPPACGCLEVEPLQLAIPSGETGRIRVTFKSQGFTGTQYKVVAIQQEGYTSLLRVTLTAEVVPEPSMPLN